MLKITPKILQLLLDPFSDRFPFRLSLLRDLQIFLPRLFSIRPWLLFYPSQWFVEKAARNSPIQAVVYPLCGTFFPPQVQRV